MDKKEGNGEQPLKYGIEKKMNLLMTGLQWSQSLLVLATLF